MTSLQGRTGRTRRGEGKRLLFKHISAVVTKGTQEMAGQENGLFFRKKTHVSSFLLLPPLPVKFATTVEIPFTSALSSTGSSKWQPGHRPPALPTLLQPFGDGAAPATRAGCRKGAGAETQEHGRGQRGFWGRQGRGKRAGMSGGCRSHPGCTEKASWDKRQRAGSDARQQRSGSGGLG